MTTPVTRSFALIVAVAVLGVALAAARLEGRAPSARDRYEEALALDRDARAVAERGDAGDVAAAKAARRALVLYESVVRRFPTSGYCDNALLRGGDLARWLYTRSGRAADRSAAAKYYAWLIREYPGSGLRVQARAAARALESAEVEPERRRATAVTAPEPARASAATSAARMATAPVTASPVSAPPAGPAPAPASAATLATEKSTPPVLRGIDRSLVNGAVRVTLMLDRETRFAHEVIDGPRRAFVDLFGAQAAADLQDRSLRYDGDAVRQVRVGRRPNATRVVLDLDGAPAVSVFTLYNPFRIVIDAERPAFASAPAPLTAPSPGPRAIVPPVPAPAAVTVATGPAAPPPSPAPAAAVIRDDVPAAPRDENELVPAVAPVVADQDLAPFDDLAPASRAVLTPAVAAVADAAPAAPPPLSSFPVPAPAAAPAPGPRPATASRATAAPPVTAPVVPSTPTADPGNDVELTAPVPSEPAANRDGSFSLARQLGIGISRIVIDPGHGGHDPGTLTSGSSEARLVLDVALRLERLLNKEPGLEVVLTRRTDVFIPLEQRTAIANREGADLFLSIHANASRDPKASGLETYFLSFASNPEAEAVAARENAASASDMHSLPSIVRAIALNNKLDESRDLASTVQQALAGRLAKSNPGLRSRGVKKAPFVVLIGAAMPSVLAEIGFITNKQEVALIKTPAYRQKIAESLHAAVLQYRRSLKRQTSVAAR